MIFDVDTEVVCTSDDEEREELLRASAAKSDRSPTPEDLFVPESIPRDYEDPVTSTVGGGFDGLCIESSQSGENDHVFYDEWDDGFAPESTPSFTSPAHHSQSSNSSQPVTPAHEFEPPSLISRKQLPEPDADIPRVESPIPTQAGASVFDEPLLSDVPMIIDSIEEDVVISLSQATQNITMEEYSDVSTLKDDSILLPDHAGSGQDFTAILPVEENHSGTDPISLLALAPPHIDFDASLNGTSQDQVEDELNLIRASSPPMESAHKLELLAAKSPSPPPPPLLPDTPHTHSPINASPPVLTAPIIPPELEQELADRPYSLRRRTNMQKNPFTLEKKLYKMQLRNNPDAIVKIRGDEGHVDRVDEYQDDTVEPRKHPVPRMPKVAPRTKQADLHRDVDSLFPDDPPDSDAEEVEQANRELVELRRRLDRPRRERSPEVAVVNRVRRMEDYDEPVGSTSKVTLDQDMDEGPPSPPPFIVDDDSPKRPASRSPVKRLKRKRQGIPVTPAIDISDDSRPPSPSLRGSPRNSPEYDMQRGFEDDYPMDNVDDNDVPVRKSPEPVDTSPEEEEEEEEAQPIVNKLKKDRKKMKALHRMFPNVLINKIFDEQDTSQRETKQRQRHSSPDAPPEPGQARTRLVHRTDAGNLGARHRIPLLDLIDLDDESDQSVDEEEVENWMSHRRKSAKPRQTTLDVVREGDLIDRMLSRTTRVTKHRRARNAGQGTSRGQGSGGSGRPRGATQAHPIYLSEDDNAEDNATPAFSEPQSLRQTKLSEHTLVDRSPQKKKQRLQKAKRVGGEGDVFIRPPPAGFVPPPASPPKRRFRRHLSTRSDSPPPTPEQTRLDDWGWLVGQSDRFGALSEDETLRSVLIQRLQVDCGVSKFREGVTFSVDTWIGSGRLAELELLCRKEAVPDPTAFTGLGLTLHAYSEAGEVVDALPSIFDSAHDWLLWPGEDNERSLEGMRFLALFLPCIFGREVDSASSLADSIADQCRHLLARVLAFLDSHQGGADMAETNARCLQLLWTMLDLEVRVLILKTHQSLIHKNFASIRPLASQLLSFLLSTQASGVAVSIAQTDDNAIEQTTLASVSLQVWVYVLHLLGTILPQLFKDDAPMDMMLQPLEVDLKKAGLGVKASERGWNFIFSVSSISYFSMHGVAGSAPAVQLGWKIVQKILGYTKLDANAQVDQTCSARSLALRDKYVKLITSRCFNLHVEWGWSLDQVKGLISDLIVIFRSRNFSKLANEKADLPKFIRFDNFDRIRAWEGSDPAFTNLLKLVVRATDPEVGDRTNPNVSRLLLTVMPVTALSFSKEIPPQESELSQLFNRFAAAYIWILLKPRDSVGKVQQCRRWTQFETAPLLVRTACIRMMKHLMMLHNHLGLAMNELFAWSAAMSSILLKELADERSAGEAQLSFGQLLRSSRNAMEDIARKNKERPTFPDLRFLNDAVSYIKISSVSKRAKEFAISDEIRDLLQAFISLREIVVPPASHATIIGEESQDEYGEFAFDLNDPALDIYFGVQAQPQSEEEKSLKLTDETFSKLVDTTILPYISSIVLNSGNIGGEATRFDKRDVEWIDRWVECINVLVRHGIKSWSNYVGLGPQSFARIPDSAHSRRVGMRLLYGVLKHDPQSYMGVQGLQDHFVTMFGQCLVSPATELEHDFISAMLTVDGMRHEWLRNIPCHRDENDTRYKLTEEEYQNARLPILRALMQNIRANMLEPGNSAPRSRAIQLIVVMLRLMAEYLATNRDVVYRTFCMDFVSLVDEEQGLGEDRAAREAIEGVMAHI